MSISNQFQASEGVSFSLEGGGFPVIAQVGCPAVAVDGPPGNGGCDNALPGQEIGSFFLTDNGRVGGLSAPALIVAYSSPTSAASGVLLDIDFNETWTIEARDAADAVLSTITLAAGDPGTEDGVATPWSFNLPAADIASLRFKGTRTIPGGFGLGFDNFDAHATADTAEPGSALLLAGGLVIFIIRRKCRA